MLSLLFGVGALDAGCCARTTQRAQDNCYQIMAATFWDYTVSGFRPGRVRAIELLNIQATDRVLLIGEGSGLDFDCLPAHTDKRALRALDFSPEMVRQSRIKARRMDIPEENCIVADAQHLPFTTERFDKIFFPLSLGSIPNPTQALRKAERVLARNGKIVVFEKLVDDGVQVGAGRHFLNVFTRLIFADITRNLTQMLGEGSPLKLVSYESLEGRLDGCLTRPVGAYYRLGLLVINADYPTEPVGSATLTQPDL